MAGTMPMALEQEPRSEPGPYHGVDWWRLSLRLSLTVGTQWIVSAVHTADNLANWGWI